ncbi:hypothetical protein DFH29DRAFT_1039960 [Suillus ampliporus]|nr:hypothetical protein DFH29DRAFT_1039960 [Suillus ampliporus]
MSHPFLKIQRLHPPPRSPNDSSFRCLTELLQVLKLNPWWTGRRLVVVLLPRVGCNLYMERPTLEGISEMAGMGQSLGHGGLFGTSKRSTKVPVAEHITIYGQADTITLTFTYHFSTGDLLRWMLGAFLLPCSSHRISLNVTAPSTDPSPTPGDTTNEFGVLENGDAQVAKVCGGLIRQAVGIKHDGIFEVVGISTLHKSHIESALVVGEREDRFG